jgi:sulfate permease, SulP family
MPMLVFLVGALLILGAYFRVADLAQYISRSVVVAYITGASVMIVANQLPAAFGIIPAAARSDGAKPAAATLWGNMKQFLAGLPEWMPWAFGVSVFTAVVFVVLRRLRPRWPAFLISLLAGTALAVGLKRFGIVIPTFDDATFGLSNLLPPFPAFVSGDASAQFAQLFGLALAVAFVSNLENSVMAKTLASRGGYRVDANQDMLSLGFANLACAYLAGMPASGSLTRSALNYESGARTQMSSIVSGTVVLIGAMTLGPHVHHVPKAVLATLVICIAVSLVHRRNIRICLRATKSDAFVFVLTFAATQMVPLHVAIFTGVGVSIMLYLRKASQPSLVEYEFNKEGNLAEARSTQRQHPSISIVHVEGDLFFGAAELFRTQIQRTCADPNLRVIILRLKNARHLDATSVMALEELVQVLRSSGRDLIVSGATRDVYRVLRDSKVLGTVGRENFFMGSAHNPNLATRNALKRAQEIIGVRDAEVQIYYDPRFSSSGSKKA